VREGVGADSIELRGGGSRVARPVRGERELGEAFLQAHEGGEQWGLACTGEEHSGDNNGAHRRGRDDSMRCCARTREQ
jgi:hypothetical protein